MICFSHLLSMYYSASMKHFIIFPRATHPPLIKRPATMTANFLYKAIQTCYYESFHVGLSGGFGASCFYKFSHVIPCAQLKSVLINSE